MFMSAVVLSCLATASPATLASADHHETAVIELTVIAPPPEPVRDASVMDPESHALRPADNGWARGPMPPPFRETPPMCNEGVWMEWAEAYLDEKGSAGGRLRSCYMLAGDEGASDIEPYSEGQTDDSHWETGDAHETSRPS